MTTKLEAMNNAKAAEKAALIAYRDAEKAMWEARKDFSREQLDLRGIKTGVDGTLCTIPY